LLTAVSLVAVTFEGAVTLFFLGLTVALGDLVRAVLVDRAVRRGLPITTHPPWRSLAWHFSLSVLAIFPVTMLVRIFLGVVSGQAASVAGVALACAAGLVAYLVLQRQFGAPELRGLRRARPLTAAAVLPTAAPGSLANDGDGRCTSIRTLK
jgi:energy-converting hydrogenase Eha subunit A